ncbi:MAG: quinoprotein dehydrogenase-associated SoxYZ-like carrier [Gammaproteobacteria bacterium]
MPHLSLRHKTMRLLVSLGLITLFMNAFAAVELEEWQTNDNWRKGKSDAVWMENIKPAMFANREILEGAGQNVLEIRAPIRAEDATVVPVSVHTLLPQTQERYIKKITVVIDKNPVPLVGIFEFTPESGKADLAMRVRVDDFSYIRAIAEMNDGELYSVKKFIRAKGACSAPPPKSAAESRKFMGRMKLNTIGELKIGQPNLVQVKILHPNVTGMAYDPVYNSRPPAHFLSSFKVAYEGIPILKAQLTFSVSQDPAFRFYFIPNQEGKLTIEATDTKNNDWVSSFEIKHT